MNGVGVVLVTESVLDCACSISSIANLGHLKSWIYVHNTKVASIEDLPVQWASWQRTCLDKRWCTHVVTMSKLKQLHASAAAWKSRSEEHTSELQSLMRNSYAVFCLKKKKKQHKTNNTTTKIERKKT